MYPNRVVAFLTPLVFAPAAGGVSAWLANHFPGVDVSQGQLQEIFIAGALIALAPAAQWLHGWQKFEAQKAQSEQAIEARAEAAAAAPLAPTEFEEPVEFDELEEFEGEEEVESMDEFEEFDEELDESDEELDEFDEELLFDEEPAPAGG